jgi:hypothetical protein
MLCKEPKMFNDPDEWPDDDDELVLDPWGEPE